MFEFFILDFWEELVIKKSACCHTTSLYRRCQRASFICLGNARRLIASICIKNSTRKRKFATISWKVIARKRKRYSDLCEAIEQTFRSFFFINRWYPFVTSTFSVRSVTSSYVQNTRAKVVVSSPDVRIHMEQPKHQHRTRSNVKSKQQNRELGRRKRRPANRPPKIN